MGQREWRDVPMQVDGKVVIMKTEDVTFLRNELSRMSIDCDRSEVAETMIQHIMDRYDKEEEAVAVMRMLIIILEVQ
eukprot:4925256-Lingulodinium_polyedra.AAC.1